MKYAGVPSLLISAIDWALRMNARTDSCRGLRNSCKITALPVRLSVTRRMRVRNSSDIADHELGLAARLERGADAAGDVIQPLAARHGVELVDNGAPMLAGLEVDRHEIPGATDAHLVAGRNAHVGDVGHIA